VFGSVDPSDDCWEVTEHLGGHPVELHLNIDGDDFPEAASRKLIERIRDLGRFEQQARKELLNAYDPSDEGCEVTSYHSHHLGECTEDELVQVFGLVPAEARTVELMVAQMQLMRVGLYPEAAEGASIVADFTIGKHISQYMLVVKFNSEGELVEVVTES
jgi:hypothetical protein